MLESLYKKVSVYSKSTVLFNNKKQHKFLYQSEHMSPTETAYKFIELYQRTECLITPLKSGVGLKSICLINLD